ncbi:hypothetical protein AB0H81_28490, partial [Nonomuraea sp. NPDC050691]
PAPADRSLDREARPPSAREPAARPPAPHEGQAGPPAPQERGVRPPAPEGGDARPPASQARDARPPAALGPATGGGTGDQTRRAATTDPFRWLPQLIDRLRRDR